MQKLLSLGRRAIEDYDMIQDGDKIAVGVSGGKDSIALLSTLQTYRRFSKAKFQLMAINIDLGFKDINQDEVQALRDYCASIDVELIIEPTEIAHIIFEDRKEKSPCSLCSKMRRGTLNSVAIANNCNKIALGHHADDVAETMLMSLLFEGRFSTFAPMSYMDRSGITLIRPFIYVEEREINCAVKANNLPIVHNPCPRDKFTKRQDMKLLIREFDKKYGSKKKILSAIFNPERNNLWDKYKLTCINKSNAPKDILIEQE